MRFLVDANVPLSVAPRIRALGHEATDVREIAMGNADDGVIARHARENAFCLITRDKDFGDIRNYPPGDYGGIIVLNLPDDFRTTDVLNACRHGSRLSNPHGCASVRVSRFAMARFYI